MGDTRLSKCAIIGELVGGAGCVGGQEKEWMGVFLGQPRSFWHHRRTVDGCSPGRGVIMAQDGGTRGDTIHGEMDCCIESQD